MKIKIIAAVGKNRELGKDEGLPDWKLASDMKRFKELTTGLPVVMGRKTFESLPEKFRPLPNRQNIVLTRDKNWKYPEVEVYSSVNNILENFKNNNTVWIIGGAEIYKQFIDIADELHITHVDGEFSADKFFPEFSLKDFEIEKSEDVLKDDTNSHNSKYSIYKDKRWK